MRMTLMCVMSLLNLPYGLFRRIDDLHGSRVHRALA
jgi:hypothetical protein